jgi:hypothetical protein
MARDILARVRWDFHGLIIEGLWDDAAIGERWQATFAPRPAVEREPDLVFPLALADDAPPAPSAPPDFEQGDLLAYYLDGACVTAHFPRFGQLRLDLARGATTGVITPAALAAYGVFEDLIAIGLSPHFRRRGLFLIHAFAAAPPPPPRRAPLPIRSHGPSHRFGVAALLVGDTSAGKTTTGLALLHAGWKLLSNDSPILTQTYRRRMPRLYPSNSDPTLHVLSYPGLLSAYPDSLARFPELAPLNPHPDRREKVLFAPESVYGDVWAEAAPPGAIFFPQIEPRPDHALERLPAPEALRLLLPHAVEQWDRAMIPAHLALLNQLVKTVPAYRLRLGPDTSTLPLVIASGLDRRGKESPSFT